MMKVKKSLHWAPSLVTNVVHLPIYDEEEEDDHDGYDTPYDFYDEFSLLRRRRTTNKLWYKKRDFQLFKQQAKQTVHYIRGEGGHNPFTTSTSSTAAPFCDVDDLHCTRGIEHLVTWETTLIRDHRVQLSRQVVFMEQSFQKVSSKHSGEANSDGGDVHVDAAAAGGGGGNDVVVDDGIHSSSYSNEDDIARVYKNIAEPLELVAYQRGLEDAREAKLIHLEQDNHQGSQRQLSSSNFDDEFQDHHNLDGEEYDEYKDGYAEHHGDDSVALEDMEPLPFEVSSSSSDDSEECDVDEDVLDSTSLRQFFRFDFGEQTLKNDYNATSCSDIAAAVSNDDTPKEEEEEQQQQKPLSEVIVSLTTATTIAPDTTTTTTFPDFSATKSKRCRVDVDIRDDLEDFPTGQTKRMKKTMPIL